MHITVIWAGILPATNLKKTSGRPFVVWIVLTVRHMFLFVLGNDEHLGTASTWTILLTTLQEVELCYLEWYIITFVDYSCFPQALHLTINHICMSQHVYLLARQIAKNLHASFTLEMRRSVKVFEILFHGGLNRRLLLVN